MASMFERQRFVSLAFAFAPALLIWWILAATDHSSAGILIALFFYTYLCWSTFRKFNLQTHRSAIKKSSTLLFISFLPILVTLMFVEKGPDTAESLYLNFTPVLSDAFALNAQFIYATSLLGPVIFFLWDGFSRLVVTDATNRTSLRPAINKKHASVAGIGAISVILLLCMALIYAQHITKTGERYVFYTLLADNSLVIYLICVLIWYMTVLMECYDPELDKDPLGADTEKLKREFKERFEEAFPSDPKPTEEPEPSTQARQQSNATPSNGAELALREAFGNTRGAE